MDAIKCAGYLKIVPTFQANYATYEVDVPSAQSVQNAEHPHLFSFDVPFTTAHTRDSATIIWMAKLATLDWISVDQNGGEGIAGTVGDKSNRATVVSHNVTLVMDVTKAPKIDTTIELSIEDFFETDPAAASLLSLSVKISNKVDANDDLACYDGALVTENLAGKCVCAPGAYGKFCELHDCPGGCGKAHAFRAVPRAPSGPPATARCV